MTRLPSRIVSGGQTGVDRAALDVAMELGIPVGGWCPAGRRAEDGTIPDRYPLEETVSPEYEVRTELNVRDSDGTLVLAPGRPKGGTAATIGFARKLRKPRHLVDLDETPDAGAFREWIGEHAIAILNVAGPRESGSPGVYDRARAALREFLKEGL